MSSSCAALLAAVHKGGIGLPGAEVGALAELFGTRTLVGAASISAAMGDDSDASYLQLLPNSQPPAQQYQLQFPTLALDSGRSIQSFVIDMRLSNSEYAANGFSFVSTEVFPSDVVYLVSTPVNQFADVLAGPFSKKGGGLWTASQFRSLLLTNGLFTSAARSGSDRISRMRLIVSYAT